MIDRGVHGAQKNAAFLTKAAGIRDGFARIGTSQRAGKAAFLSYSPQSGAGRAIGEKQYFVNIRRPRRARKV